LFYRLFTIFVAHSQHDAPSLNSNKDAIGYPVNIGKTKVQSFVGDFHNLRRVGTVAKEYGVFDENASGASFIETGILKTSQIHLL